MMLALLLWLQISGGAAEVRDDVRVEDGIVAVHRAGRSCRFYLSDADREHLAAALRLVRPDDWKARYGDASCRDCLLHSLQVGDRTVVWDDAGARKLPSDAKAVAEALEALMRCQ